MRFEQPQPDPTPPRELRVDFHTQLDSLDARFLDAAMALVDALPKLRAGFLSGDAEAAAVAAGLAASTDETCEEIDEDGFILLAREGPALGDLRRIIALVRATRHLERSASLVKHICETRTHVDPATLPDEVRNTVVRLYDEASDVFSACIGAWRSKDPDAVRAVDLQDDRVDELQELLVELSLDRSWPGAEALAIGLIARYLERLADHGVAIAQDAAFVATGNRIPVGKRREA